MAEPVSVQELEALLCDPTVGSVEFSKVGARAGLECTVYRHEPIYVVKGHGTTAAEALADAYAKYKGT